MAHIVSQLNLNKTPQLTKDYSMVFAKNIKLQKDTSITKDSGMENIPLGGIRNLDRIYGIIPYNTKFYILGRTYTNPLTPGEPKTYKDGIWEYDENTSSFKEIKSGWKYSGSDENPSEIIGEVVVSLNGDIVINIAEYNPVVDVPFKTINLAKCSANDDQSIYTQTPKIPFINLKQIDTYPNTIPNGVYQFFIRYEIWKDYYTDWFPCTRTCYAGSKKIKDTNFGRLSYIDEDRDSGTSFVFQVDKPDNINDYNYKRFQIGFILTHDNDTVARSWKFFDYDTSVIYFDYDQNFIRNEDMREFLNPTYGVYGVKNLTSFKNKMYIANYKETDFNPHGLESFASTDNINIQIEEKAISDEFNATYRYFEDGEYHSDQLYINELNNCIEGIGVYNPISSYYANNICHETEGYLKKSLHHRTPIIYQIHGVFVRVAYSDGYETESPSHGYIPSTTYALKIGNNDIKEKNSIFEFYNDFYSQKININSGKTDNDITFYYNQDGWIEIFDVKIYIDIDNVEYNKLVINTQTLLPIQEYKFYVHWVKETGEITNGYQIGDTYSIPYNKDRFDSSSKKIYYPIFTINEFPEGYSSCFFTIQHYSKKIYEVFDAGRMYKHGFGHCIEFDLGFVGSDDIYKIITDIDSDTGEYVYKNAEYIASNNAKYMQLYGAEGLVVLKNNEAFNDIAPAYALFDYSNDSDDVELIKCTPFIRKETEGNTIFDDYAQEELLGFICTVFKFKELTSEFATSNGIYIKTTNDRNIKLEEYTEDEYKKFKEPKSNIIYSPYNLNFLSLNFDINEIFKVIGKTVEKSESSSVVTEITRETSVFHICVPSSIQISYIYKLSSMYRNILRKTYSKIGEAEVKFDNTIRASEMIGDENTICIYKFKPSDYYNIPTSKDIIVNINAVGNQFLVHTKDSLFGFDGSNKISSSGGQVQTIESDIFETGIQEIINSERGYAGIDKKNHAVMTQFGYIFFDKSASKIYQLGGTEGLPAISDSIDKVLKYKEIDDVYFADDPKNDRFIAHIIYTDGNKLTISYNFNSKSFISLHDFAFDYSFSTKTNCYLVKRIESITPVKIVRFNDDTMQYDSTFVFADTLYPRKIMYNHPAAIIDVICTDGYEVIKTLNSIAWTNNKVKDFLKTITSDVRDNLIAEEYFDGRYPGDYIRIYSDSCCTDLIDINDESNKYALGTDAKGSSPVEENRPVKVKYTVDNSYKKPRYNKGYWSFNYFRNILDTDDKYLSGSFADNQSLIYGKYFVARFVFDFRNKFKFENIIFNYGRNQ